MIDSSGIPVATTAGTDEIDPAVANTTGGKWVVDYENASTRTILQKAVSPK